MSKADLMKAMSKSPYVPSNIGRKRTPVPQTSFEHPSTGSNPNKKLFNDARKGSKHDQELASSPLGPSSLHLPFTDDPSQFDQVLTKLCHNPTASQIVRGTGIDGREPAPVNSPSLPALFEFEVQATQNVGLEPLSSGFTSPAGPSIPHEADVIAESIDFKTELVSLHAAEVHADVPKERRRLLKNPTFSGKNIGTIASRKALLSVNNNHESMNSSDSDSVHQQRQSEVLRPDPNAEDNFSTLTSRSDRSSEIKLDDYDPSPLHTSAFPLMPHFYRADWNGSPLAFSRHKHLLAQRPIEGTLRTLNKSSRLMLKGQHQSTQDELERTEQKSRTTYEAFRPGWVCRPTSAPNTTPKVAEYPFPIAAAMLRGHSLAPDSRLRKPFKNDTLTSSAKATSRFSSIGLGTSANYGGRRLVHQDDYNDRSKTAPTQSRHKEFLDNSEASLYQTNSLINQSKQEFDAYDEKKITFKSRTKFQVISDNQILSTPKEEAQPQSYVDTEDGELCKIHCGRVTPKTPDNILTDLGPNVTSWREGTSRVRKKRRPSYWDGDLEEVRYSPAARYIENADVGTFKVCSSEVGDDSTVFWHE